jgi:phage terminase large subunit GpA-like protein
MGLPDGDGSTKKKIKFARSNGYVLLAGANSAAGLRQRTVRYAIEDDLDQWPDDLDGQGSPEEHGQPAPEGVARRACRSG